MTENILGRIAINNFTYRRYSFDYFLESAVRLGVKQLELSGCHPHFTVYEAEHFDVKGLAKKIREKGLEVAAIEPEQNFLPINIASVNQYLREESVRQLRFYIESAPEFGCDKVILYPGKALVNYPHSQAWNYACESIDKLRKTAKACGVTLLLEAVSPFISDLMPDSSTVKRMMDELGQDGLGCCVNSSAASLAGETLEDYFEKFGDKIGMVQLSDNVEDNDQLVLGEGGQDLSLHLQTLKKYQYAGPVSLEIIMEEYAYQAEHYYEESISYLKKHLEK